MSGDTLVEALIAMTFSAVIVFAIYNYVRLRRNKNERSGLEGARRGQGTPDV
ncbi:MAG: hypothetical protein NW215_01770 [Hyphomicrobiales bacterium]|nr:hypothetical protein [Hyphomicrobiales bacterium]